MTEIVRSHRGSGRSPLNQLTRGSNETIRTERKIPARHSQVPPNHA